VTLDLESSTRWFIEYQDGTCFYCLPKAWHEKFDALTRINTRDTEREAEEERARERKLADERARKLAEERARAIKLAEERAKEAEEKAAREEHRLAEEIRRAREEAENKRLEREAAEKRLKAGVQPLETPTMGQILSFKRARQYTNGIFHLAVAGKSGCGKSSLVNALRSLRDGDDLAAATGQVETTHEIARYELRTTHHIALYDIPGAGTLSVPDHAYFCAQGLYVFDGIIVLFGDRLTSTDILLLKECRRFNIPSYLVRSKSELHINSIVEKMSQDDDDEHSNDDEDTNHRPSLLQAARNEYVTVTRNSVNANLLKAGLPLQELYLVSRDKIYAISKQTLPKGVIDETHLWSTLLARAPQVK
jgi:hypothetical protein